MSDNFNNVQKNINDICQAWGKSAVSLMNLNIQTFQKFSQFDGVQELLNAKQPSDVTKAQAKLLSEVGKEVTNYNQNVLNLVLDSQKEISEKVSEITGEFTNKSASGPKKAA